MKIRYKKKHQNLNLIFGLIWAIFGLLVLNYKDHNHLTDYGYIVLSIFYVILYFYRKSKQYLIIDNESIKVNTPFGKKIKLSEINWIKKFASDYILITDNQELTINTELIDKNSLMDLNTILGKLDLPPEKTPFANKA